MPPKDADGRCAYEFESGSCAVLPNAIDAATLKSLQDAIEDDDDFPLRENQLERLVCADPDVQIFAVRGWVPPHEDAIPPEFGECVTLGLVIEDSIGSLLSHGGEPLRLSPGCVYRLDPRLTHGTTCALPDEERGDEHGVFVFAAADFALGSEPDPKEFATGMAALASRELKARRA